eukprot:1039788-Rhodomonas_salina.1
MLQHSVCEHPIAKQVFFSDFEHSQSPMADLVTTRASELQVSPLLFPSCSRCGLGHANLWCRWLNQTSLRTGQGFDSIFFHIGTQRAKAGIEGQLKLEFDDTLAVMTPPSSLLPPH